MSDLANGIRVAGSQLESMGRHLVATFGPLEVWTAVLLGGALAIDRALAGKTRASLRIALYAPVALRVVVPLDWGVGASLFHVPRVAGWLAPLARIGARPAGEPATWQAPSAYALLAVGYVVVAVVLAARAVLARVRLGRALASAAPAAISHPALTCRVLQHEELGPMAVGLVSPRIVVPSHLLAPGAEDALACVLRHEAAHLRRRDAWLSAAMQLLAIVAWPVVPLWIATARVRQLIELACDEAALADADGTERRRYGLALLDVAQWQTLEVASLGAGELHFGSTLRARIEALVPQRRWPLAAQALVLTLAPAALFAGCGGSTALPGPASGDDNKDYGYQFEADPMKPAPSAAAVEPPRDAVGRIPPEAIQNVVRASFGRFRRCYEAGLARDAKLAGIVSVAYVIGEDGTTSRTADHESTLPDKEVVRCVVNAFGDLTYPKPEGGVVTVVYPVEFSP